MGGTVRPVAIRLAERQERGVNGRRVTARPAASVAMTPAASAPAGMPCMHGRQAAGAVADWREVAARPSGSGLRPRDRIFCRAAPFRRESGRSCLRRDSGGGQTAEEVGAYK